MEPTPRTVAEHVERVLALVTPLPADEVTLARLVDRGSGTAMPGEVAASTEAPVLAQDVYAVGSVPAFDHSAMDGYAVRSEDLPLTGDPVTLQVVADIPAAATEPRDLAPGTAARIMTGAPLPPGADAVVPVERTSTGRFDPVAGSRPRAAAPGQAETERRPAGDTVTLGREPRDHIRLRGSDIAAGSVLARAGRELTAPVVAALAAAGVTRVGVRRRPRVAVVATGSELVPSGSPARPGQITDSNSLMLAAAARAAGADVVRLGPVPDDADALRTVLDEAVGHVREPGRAAGRSTATGPPADTSRRGSGQVARAIDLVVTAGGVSAGAADVVRAVLSAGTTGPAQGGGGRARTESDPDRAGAEPDGDRRAWDGAVSGVDLAAVGMKPGRPQALARWRGTPWIAVPGTPVAAYVSFVMFVRPAIHRLRGLPHPVPELRPAAAGWKSPRGREQVVPVRVLPQGVAPTGDGHHLSALLAADALAVVAAGVEKVEPGDPVPVIQL
ncbi:molybdopterin molybdotransferase MoeA [Myceligenerans indicum]|uniref:Molybdopterin molybdenumtransferase n=1 Tax=Myceligenerans indicum TaxID=2593663 RepID=A0ABS1LPE9_9MICO|nr:molybdopterin molybdotransferase MoeA [Myceligenerans indicum]MBL0887944.1 molybdopterin molybdotransferase MoeA [Myceligenerans indicum]